MAWMIYFREMSVLAFPVDGSAASGEFALMICAASGTSHSMVRADRRETACQVDLKKKQATVRMYFMVYFSLFFVVEISPIFA